MDLSLSQRCRTFFRYASEGVRCPDQTRAWLPPKDEFFELICDHMKGKVHNIIDLGTGAALLPIAMLQRHQLEGTCIALDCNPRFIRTAEKNLVDTRVAREEKERVKLIVGQAQDIRSIAQNILNNEKIDVATLSFPARAIGLEATRRVIMDMVPRMSSDAKVMLWNVLPTAELMHSIFSKVDTIPIKANHWILPLQFELNIGEDPFPIKEQTGSHDASAGNGALHAHDHDGDSPLKRSGQHRSS